MVGRWIVGAVGAAAMAASALASAPDRFAERVLIAHNLARARLGAPPLAWSPRLAEEARAWAAELASTGRFEHAAAGGDTGENLWTGPAGRYTTEQMIGGFLAEAALFQPGTFPNVSRTGRWQDVGHYSQVICADTRELGCAIARGTANDILVCRYFPAGNVRGMPVGYGPARTASAF